MCVPFCSCAQLMALYASACEFFWTHVIVDVNLLTSDDVMRDLVLFLEM